MAHISPTGRGWSLQIEKLPGDLADISKVLLPI
jgi:hypothetical protein